MTILPKEKMDKLHKVAQTIASDENLIRKIINTNIKLPKIKIDSNNTDKNNEE